MGTGGGSFGPPLVLATPWGPGDLEVADLNGDGHLDIATDCAGGDDQSSLEIFYGRGDGTFLPRVGYRGTSTADQVGPVALDSADPDRDGDLDLAVANWAPGDFCYYENEGDGTFAPFVRYGIGPTPSDLRFADMDRDGIPDVVSVIGIPPSNLSRAVAVVPGREVPTTGVSPDGAGRGLALLAAQPNPFGSATTVTFRLEEAAPVRLSVHDVAGREIAILADGVSPAGLHHLAWDGRTRSGERASPGVYFARLNAAGRSGALRLLVVR
jgi:hypothetical protein